MHTRLVYLTHSLDERIAPLLPLHLRQHEPADRRHPRKLLRT
jgi:hypothetical protein